MGLPKAEERKETDEIFEVIMAGIFVRLMIEIKPHI